MCRAKREIVVAACVRINNVKNVVSMLFDIPEPGVYVLTGRNGAGKTTLLAALYRIGYRNAFADYFKTTSSNLRLDSFLNASISYEIDDKVVSYNYGNSRWAPTPKRNSILLESFGFPKVVFIAANAKRIEPSADDVKQIKTLAISKQVTDSISQVLADVRFKDLKYINTRRGGGSRAYLLPSGYIGKKQTFYSEKNFSLGELCVIKLINEIDVIPRNSLVLIDEIEMALHPRAQAALLDYLVKVGKEKSLTIIFSTHSSSLIKRAGRKRIIFLDGDGRGNINSVRGCFPAQALGDISIDEDMSPDLLFFVEDEKASHLLEAIMVISLKDVLDVAKPVYKIVPVGGFKQVMEFLVNSDQLFSDSVRRFAVLDKDVETESIKEARDNEKHEFLAFYDAHKVRIKYLPCTPELGLCDLFLSNFDLHIENFKKFGRYSGFDMSKAGRDVKLDIALTGSKKRKSAKKVISDFIDVVARKSGNEDAAVCRKLISYYVKATTEEGANHSELGKALAFSNT